MSSLVNTVYLHPSEFLVIPLVLRLKSRWHSNLVKYFFCHNIFSSLGLFTNPHSTPFNQAEIPYCPLPRILQRYEITLIFLWDIKLSIFFKISFLGIILLISSLCQTQLHFLVIDFMALGNVCYFYQIFRSLILKISENKLGC